MARQNNRKPGQPVFVLPFTPGKETVGQGCFSLFKGM
jgi:hypothetical protein